MEEMGRGVKAPQEVSCVPLAGCFPSWTLESSYFLVSVCVVGGLSERRETPALKCGGVLGFEAGSAARGPSSLGGDWGSVWSVYTGEEGSAPPSLLPSTCQLGISTTGTVTPGRQACCVTWASVTASLNRSCLPWKVGMITTHGWRVAYSHCGCQ